MGMHTADFDYELPGNLIAQEPIAERDQSRLMVVRRQDQAIEHHVFHDLPELLAPRDLLVLNDTRVVRARLVGRRARTGGQWEGLFLRALPEGLWEMMCQTRGRLTAGEIIEIEPGPLRLRLLQTTEEGRWLVQAEGVELATDVVSLLERHGQVPLPPYIRKGRAAASDRERYQTVYAREAGAVAAPTAGLHFTQRVFKGLARRSIEWTFVTLHVGLGTFQPIQVDDISQHHMHREWGSLSQASAEAMLACRQRGGRIVAVGTTAVRLLETVAGTGPLRPWSGETDVYIYPPYRFHAVDALITNFHLPRTSLMLLVSALAGIDLIRQAYKTAIEAEYRFYSYGDAMLIL